VKVAGWKKERGRGKVTGSAFCHGLHNAGIFRGLFHGKRSEKKKKENSEGSGRLRIDDGWDRKKRASLHGGEARHHLRRLRKRLKQLHETCDSVPAHFNSAVYPAAVRNVLVLGKKGGRCPSEEVRRNTSYSRAVAPIPGTGGKTLSTRGTPILKKRLWRKRKELEKLVIRVTAAGVWFLWPKRKR